MSASEKRGVVLYHRLPDELSKQDKLDFLSEMRLHTVPWRQLEPNDKHTWLRSDTEDEFAQFLSIGRSRSRSTDHVTATRIFDSQGPGVSTSRDSHVYDFRLEQLATRMRKFVQNYNVNVALFHQQSLKPKVDDFVDYNSLKWSSTLKKHLERGEYASYSRDTIRTAMFRPFCVKHIYFDPLLVERPGRNSRYYPRRATLTDNKSISMTDKGSEKPFMAMATDSIPDYHLVGPGAVTQCFPFYTYDEDGSNRRENITDWALAQFRDHYADPAITKWDIFYYIYALLHHPGYRERYAADLKRELPRIPFAPAPHNTPLSPPIAMGGGSTDGSKSLRRDSPHQCFGEGPGVGFRQFSIAGKALADLHLNYESAEKYSLRWSALKQPLDYKVVKMRPGKKHDAKDGDYKVFDSLRYNDTLLASGIPERAFAYRLGNRSALEWVIDQYRVKTDKRSGITHDPNGYSDDEKYIVELIERVITVSLRTVEIVDELAQLPFRES